MQSNALAFFRVVVVGDSIGASAGVEREKSFPNLIAHQLRERHKDLRLVNLSIAGDSLTSAERRIAGEIGFSGHPDILIIELGGNDLLAGAGPAILEERLDSLVRTAKKSAAHAKIIIVGVGYNSTGDRSPYRKVSDKYSVLCVDNFTWVEPARKDLRQEDGIHPNAAGHREIANAVLDLLNPGSSSDRS